MKVLLKRALYLGGILYEPNAAGTIIPNEVDGKKVVLYDPADPPIPRRDPKVLFALSRDGTQMERQIDERLTVGRKVDDERHMLPEDAKLWSEEGAKGWSPEHIPLIKGHPQLGDQVPLSALTPGLSKAETEAAIKKDQPKNLTDRAMLERDMLDPGIVGKQSLDGDDDNAGVKVPAGSKTAKDESDFIRPAAAKK